MDLKWTEAENELRDEAGLPRTCLPADSSCGSAEAQGDRVAGVLGLDVTL